MPVQLRERRKRPSYKEIKESEDEDNVILEEEEERFSDESTFELPEKDNGLIVQDLDSNEEDQLTDDQSMDEIDSSSKQKTKQNEIKPKAKAGAAGPSKSKPSMRVVLAPGLSRPVLHQQYALPAPSINHRYRGIPLHVASQRTLRLTAQPSPFSSANLVSTNSVAVSAVGMRVTKASSCNIGRGPIWELMEDRSWYKESESEDGVKPLVYQSVPLGDCRILSETQASCYIPGIGGSSDDIACYLGPHDRQTKMNLKRFDSHAMDKYFSGSKAHVFYAGGPVWALDWCPISTEELVCRNYKQYIAIGPLPSRNYNPEIGRRVPRPCAACIQIWSLASSPDKSSAEDPGQMKCEMVLCIDAGPAHELKWCPLPAHDKHTDSDRQSQLKKLGILGGTFEDGSLSIYVVPDPSSIRSDSTVAGPVFVEVSPTIRIDLGDTTCWCLDWGNSDILAVGCTNGYIAVFHLQTVLENPSDKLLRPTHYIAAHQSAIRSLCWVKAPPVSTSGVPRVHSDPTVIISGGYDGAQMVTDIRDGRANILNRVRDIINTVAFSYHVGGSIAADNESMIKNFCLTPSMLGRGHIILEPSGPVWSISTSNFHPQIAVGSADGTCRTTNSLKAVRRGGLVPFLTHKIFQMDYNSATKEFRILENLMPYEQQDKTAGTKESEEAPHPGSTGAWWPEISVTKVAWNSASDIARSPFLASATASGICRVDWLLGRFIQGRFPYQNIQLLRGEIEGDIDMEGEDDD